MVEGNAEQLWGAMRQLGEQISDIRRDVSDVRERMIRLEATSVHSTVENLERRIDSLEAFRDRTNGVNAGVGRTADWLYKLAPWIFATALVVITNWQNIF